MSALAENFHHNTPFIEIFTRLSASIELLCKFFRLRLLPKTTQLANKLADDVVILQTANDHVHAKQISLMCHYITHNILSTCCQM